MGNINRNLITAIISVKKYISRIAGILGALIIFLVITDVLNYMYVNGYETAKQRALWHYFYEDNGKIDNLFLGSSHVYSDINPMQLDEINGQYNFNLASASQRLNGSYYLLKEADKYNSLSHVYLELYYKCIKESEGLDPIDTELHFNWQNTDEMKFSSNKLEYMLSIAGPEKYLDIILPFSRYRSELNNWNYINTRLDEKSSEDYLTYKCRYDYYDDTYHSEYMRQGYYYSTKVAKDKMFIADSGVMKENPIGEKTKEYLYKIIDYCKKRNIPITLFATPINELQLVNIRNYDYYVNQVREIADECEVEYYDFNLVKDEYLSVDDVEYFRDYSHLNTEGARLFTNFFAKVISETPSENEKYFYSSYAEKLRNQTPKVCGLYYSDELPGLRTLWIAANRDDGMEYSITITPEGKETYVVQEFAQNNEFTVPKDEHGICTIMARMTDNMDEVQTLEINY